MSARERERRVQTFYRAREARLRSEGSSEDVWEARAEEDIVEWAEGQCKFDRNEWEQSGTLLVRKGS